MTNTTRTVENGDSSEDSIVTVAHGLCEDCSESALVKLKNMLENKEVIPDLSLDPFNGDSLLHTTLRLHGIIHNNNNEDSVCFTVRRLASFDPVLASAYLERVCQCVHMLVKAGSSPTCQNSQGQTPIDLMLLCIHGTLLVECRTLPPDLYMAYVTGINQILQSLADTVNHTQPLCNDIENTLALYLQILIDYPIVHLEAIGSGIFRRGMFLLCHNQNTVRKLCDNYSKLLPLYTMVATWCIKSANWMPMDYRLITMLMDVFDIMVNRGLPMSVFMPDLFSSILVLPCMSVTVMSNKFWQRFLRFVSHIFTEGGNPNVVHWTGNTMIVPLVSSSDFLAPVEIEVNFCRLLIAQSLDLRALESALDLLLLLHLTLTQEALFKLTDSISNELMTTSLSAFIQKLAGRIRRLGNEPRSLYLLSSRATYEALNWQIRRYVNQLPLPKSVRAHLTDRLSHVDRTVWTKENNEILVAEARTCSIGFN